MTVSNFRTYEMAIEFYRGCLEIKCRNYIKDQLERASLSVVLNLAEGAAKPTRRDKKKFFAIAYGSVKECRAILRVLNREEEFAKADEIGACAYRLMKSME